MAAMQRPIGKCVVSHAQRLALFSQSGSRGPAAQRCGRPTACPKAKQGGHSRASPAVLRLVDNEGKGGGVAQIMSFGACGRRGKSINPTENRSTTARDTHCRSTNFFSESDSQTAGLVPGSASAILTSLPPSFPNQRRRLAACT
ncbi:hypothetical protein Q7P36_002339 [Cladosporium allicinum]